MSRILTISFLGVLSFISDASGQQTPRAPKPAADASTKLFSQELCNVSQLVTELRSAIESIPKKNQFEDDASYQERFRKAFEKQIPKSRLVDVACELAGGPKSHKIEYDANLKAIKLPSGLGLGLNNDVRSNVVQTYTGQNAYGVTRDVKVIERYAVGFHWPGESQVKEYRVNISPEVARSQWDSLRFAVIGDIIEPFIEKSEFKLDANINSPTELRSATDYIVLVPKQLLLFNNSSRQILHLEQIKKCSTGYGKPNFRLGKC
jgi:hypothetical protein